MRHTVTTRDAALVTLKEYAPTTRGEQPPEVPFAMIFIRDGVEERHEFVANPTMGWQDVRGLIPLMGGKADDQALSQAAIRVVDRLIGRSLDNTDGTPEKWRPNVVDGFFTAPNGDHTAVELLPGFESFDAGSSRRRWVHLMEKDDDITVEPDQIVALMADLLEVAANRPTTRSAP